MTFIAGGIILVLTINFMLNTVLSVVFLQPPLSAQAITSASKYADVPIFIYNSLFAISEEYLFRGVVLYMVYSYVPLHGVALEITSVTASSLAWVVFHLFVYGSQPLVLAFVFFTGIVFGVITVYSNNILAASAIHVTNNLIASGLTVINTAAVLGVVI
jgi:membrane protease YdiL (CAAX protease family)